MEAIGAASNPLQARDMIRTLNPDVLTLDVEMPEMDGLTFLEKLMRLRPMPVLMISSLTERGSEAALRALELGAVDFLAKPKLGISDGMREYADDIAEKIRVAYLSKSRLARQSSAIRHCARSLASSGEPHHQHGKDYYSGSVYRRHRGDQGVSDPLAGRCAGYPDCAAHAGSLYQIFCRAA